MGHVDPSARPVYTLNQVHQYFDRIKLPQKYRSLTAYHGGDDKLALLSKIVKYQIAAIPFENLELHYSSHHTVSLDPMHLFHKMVERHDGRGGYCMENTCILGTVLRSLGYDVMPTGARVNEALQPIAAGKSWTGPKFDGWNHMINIVMVAGEKYLVDVGFGSNGPTFPVPLKEGYSAVNVRGGAGGGHTMILKREHIPDNTHKKEPQQLLWMYSLRFNDSGEWMPGYCFSEIEFLPRDFQTMNFFVSKSLTSWFTYHVVALRFLMDENEDVIGDITMFGTDIKERRYGESRALCTISSEEERVEALQKYLGITLSQPERAGITGMITMIP